MIEGELGAFLRSRREAVTPAEVGLPGGARRRTPGLRRAELATLAGVSVDYLIRIEQGRDTHPSPQVLAALADALRLGEDDRNHLRQLSIISSGSELCPHARAAARAVRPTVHAVLEQLEPAPALVVNHLTDVLAWTAGYERLARPLGILDGDEPNLLWFTFTDERARAAYPTGTRSRISKSPTSTPRCAVLATMPAHWPITWPASPAPTSPLDGIGVPRPASAPE
jgi:transcriptional regulator with XRE-family HTH domain